nr:hypothetical protein [Gemmatimonadales bacterium]
MSRPVLLFGLVLGLSVLVAGDAAAQREGFIAGIGTGPGFTAQDVDRDVGSRLGLATDLKVGAMLSESVQLYATGKWNAFSDWGTLIASGLGGLGVTYEMASGFNLNGAAGVAM